ncbi:MAG: carbohydrate kinase family protein [Bacteroidota bacterium]|nr:carbohydrate kinase family protein [Bacteroidota bacterium]MDP4190886.1 carbohydrate kinase family protein [Bacteroidota bacterium]
MDIVALGTVAMDVILQVDSLPSEDGFALIKERNYMDGGSAANVIVQAQRLGASCGLIAQVGDDEIGKAIIGGLDKEGVDTTSMVIKQGGSSLHTTIVVGENGKKFILLNMGDSFLNLKACDVKSRYLTSSKIFYTDLIPGEPAFYALKLAKEAGLKTVVNIQIGIPMMEQFGIKRKDILDALSYVDVFAPCREAFYQLTETEDHMLGIKSFMKTYKGLLLLTLGSSGSISSQNGELIDLPSFKVEALDTTGAGDSYLGAFIYSYLVRNMKLKEAMHFSSAAAALTCKAVGARSSRNLSEVEEFAGKLSEEVKK